MSIIKTKQLSYEYTVTDDETGQEQTRQALNDLTFSVQPGEFIAILGRNGSGKSTLARHINALLLPGGGDVWIEGMNTRDEEKLWDIRTAAGMVFQNPDNQIVATVVEEDVGFGPENIGIPTEEIWERVSRSLEAVGMTAYAKKAPHRLSGGQKQRVAIAGVLAMRPKCIVFDESTAMLDPRGRREVLSTMQALNRQEGITILLITHYMEEAALADRILIMDRGQLAMDAAPREIFSQSAKLKELGLAVPQMTELADRLRNKGLPLSPGIFSEEALAEELVRLWKERGERRQ